MAKGRRGRPETSGALRIVNQARSAARSALDKLRGEIQDTRERLERLLEAEKEFRADILDAAQSAARTVRGKKRGRKTQAATGRRRRRGTAKRRGTPHAERYFKKLPTTFTLEDVRKLAGRRAGISLAQWSRSKRIKKVGDRYKKVA